MFKKVFSCIFCVLFLVSVFCGCKNKRNVDNEAETTLTYDDSSVNDDTTSIDNTTVNDTVTDVDSNVPEWKLAYLDLLEEYNFRHEGYALVFIDDDDIPELYMTGDCEATGDGVYSFKNGEIVEQRLHRIGGGRYFERSGCFANNNGHMGATYTVVYELTDSGFITTFEALRIERVGEYLGEEQYEINLEYYIGDEPVDEADYEDAKNNAFDLDSAVELYDQKVSYEEIVQQINEF